MRCVVLPPPPVSFDASIDCGWLGLAWAFLLMRSTVDHWVGRDGARGWSAVSVDGDGMESDGARRDELHADADDRGAPCWSRRN